MKRLNHPYRHKVATWIIATVLASFIVSPCIAQRETQTINDSWKFLKGECAAASDSAFDDSQWSSIHLPHTWNTDAYTEKDYYRGTGWYRRPVHIPGSWEGKQIFLKLDAASKAATIYINGKQVDEHTGGYTCLLYTSPSPRDRG